MIDFNTFMLFWASYIIFGITCSFTIQVFANNEDFKVGDFLRGVTTGYLYLLVILGGVLLTLMIYYDKYKPYLRRKYLRLMAVKLFKVKRK